MYKASAFIHGEPVGFEDDSRPRLAIYSPLDHECIGTIPELTYDEKKYIFDSGWMGAEKWSNLDYKTRAKFILRFSDKLRENIHFLSNLIRLESGKSIEESRDEVSRSIEYIVESVHIFHNLIEHPREYHSGKYPLLPDEIRAVYFRVPLGVVLTITPFNYPLNTMITKIVPAILMGNTVVHKSSMNGSLTGWAVSRIFNELNVDGYSITPGVLNYYTGRGSELETFLESEKIKISALSFTGSSAAGHSISRVLAPIPTSLELSGLNVAFVLEDARLEDAGKEILNGKFKFSGQRCTSIQLVCVHSSVEAELIEILKDGLGPFYESFSPLISLESLSEIREIYENALQNNAILVTPKIDWETITGSYLPPIIFSNVSFDSLICRKEVFGPVLGIIAYEELESMIENVNKMGYGLQASIFSENLNYAGEIAMKIEVGRVNINTAPSRSPDYLPFPLSNKSGMGEQGIVNSLYFFSKYRGIVYRSYLSHSEDGESKDK